MSGDVCVSLELNESTTDCPVCVWTVEEGDRCKIHSIKRLRSVGRIWPPDTFTTRSPPPPPSFLSFQHYKNTQIGNRRKKLRIFFRPPPKRPLVGITPAAISGTQGWDPRCQIGIFDPELLRVMPIKILNIHAGNSVTTFVNVLLSKLCCRPEFVWQLLTINQQQIWLQSVKSKNCGTGQK